MGFPRSLRLLDRIRIRARGIEGLPAATSSNMGHGFGGAFLVGADRRRATLDPAGRVVAGAVIPAVAFEHPSVLVEDRAPPFVARGTPRSRDPGVSDRAQDQVTSQFLALAGVAGFEIAVDVDQLVGPITMLSTLSPPLISTGGEKAERDLRLAGGLARGVL